MSDQIRIGTRESKLALWQSHWVAGQLKKLWPALKVSLVPIKTTGDKIVDAPLARIGGKGLFIKEIENALLEGLVDVAVHSIKDLPAVLPKELLLFAVPPREDASDVLVSADGLKFFDLPAQSKVGSGSLRRVCQLKRKRGDLVYLNLRGNVDTRVKKLEKGEYDAIVLAFAGLKRLQLGSLITETLDTIPAVGQGAMGIEIRGDDERVMELMAPLNDAESQFCVMVERAFLTVMGAGCQVPLGCHAHYKEDLVEIRAFVSDPDGKLFIERARVVEEAQAVAEAEKMAKEMLKAGGKKILEELEKTAKKSIPES